MKATSAIILLAAFAAPAEAQWRRSWHGKCGNSTCTMCYEPGTPGSAYSSWDDYYRRTGRRTRSPYDRRSISVTHATMLANGWTAVSDKPAEPEPPKIASTPQLVVDAMCAAARLTPEDIVYDPGCGDGRFLVTAYSYGARGIGIDNDPAVVQIARKACKKMAVRILEGNVLKYNYGNATVVFLYLDEELLAKLVPRFTGARVILSYCHQIPGHTNAKQTLGGGHVFYLAYPQVSVPAAPPPPSTGWRRFERS